MNTAAVLRIVVTANGIQQTNRALLETDAAGKRAGATMDKLGGTVKRSAKLAAEGALAITAAATGMAVKFNASMEMIHTQAGATQKEVDTLRGKVLELAKSLPQSPQQLSEGLFHLESIGLRGAKAMNALKIAAQGAAVGHADLEDTATALGSAWIVNIKGAGNLRHVMGLLNATVGAGNVRMGDLVQALGTGLLPASKQAGLSIKDVFAAMAVFTDEGYQASSAAAQFSTALHFLYNPTTKASNALEAMGLKSSQLAEDMHKPNGLLVALTDLKRHLDEAGKDHGKVLAVGNSQLDAVKTAAVRQEQLLGAILPGGRGRIMLTLLNQLDRYQMKLHQIGAGVKNFSEDVRKTQETDAYKIKAAWSTIQVALINLGSKVAPFAAEEFRKLADVIGDPKLTDQQKFDKLSAELSKVLSKTFSAAANEAGKEAPKVALAFVNGFASADSWGRLAAAGFIATKLGLWKKLFATAGAEAGAAGGTAAAAAMTATTSVASKVPIYGPRGQVLSTVERDTGQAAEGAAAASGFASGMRGQLSKFAPILHRLALLDLGNALVTGVSDAVHGKNWKTVWQDAASSATLGIIPKKSQQQADATKKTISELKQKLDDLANAAPHVKLATASLTEMLRTGDYFRRRLIPQLDATKLNIGAAFDYIKKHADALGPEGVKAADSFVHGLGKIKTGIQTLEASSGDSVRSLRKVFDSNMSEIASSMGKHSAAGARLAQQNFNEFAAAVRRSMGEGVTSTQAGMAAITAAFKAELQSVGYKGSISQALELRTYQDQHGKGTGGGQANLAGGGYLIGRRGEKGPDNVHVRMPRGWAVLNGHQQGALGLAGGGLVDALVGRGEMLVPPSALPGYNMLAHARGYAGLSGLFSKVRTPHYMAGGGTIPDPKVSGPSSPLKKVVQGAIDTADRAANSAIGRLGLGAVSRMISAGNQIAGHHFPYVYGGGHGSFNGPYDCSGAVSALLHAAGLLGSPITTDGLKVFGEAGDGRFITIGVRGSTGKNAHTMLKIGDKYFESGGGHGAQWVGGWDGSFPIHRHPKGFAKGGMVEDPSDPRSPEFIGWGLARGGLVRAAGGLLPRAAAAAKKLPKKAAKLPKAKRFKPLHLQHLDGGEYDKQLHAIDSVLSKDVPSLSELYNYTSQGWDLTDFTFVVTPDDGSAPYIDQTAVDTRVTELTQLVTWQTQIKDKLSTALGWTQTLIPQLVEGLKKRRAEIDAIRAKVKKNLAQIKKLEADLKAEEAKALPKGKGHAAAAQAKADKIKGYQHDIGVLKDENQRLAGDRDHIGSGGTLGSLRKQYTNWQDTLSTARQNVLDVNGVSGVGGLLGDTSYTLAQLTKQLGDLDPAALQKALSAASAGASATGGGNSVLTDLLQQQLQQSQLAFGVSQAQYKVLAQMPPYGGSFAAGGIVPGVPGAPRTVIAHGGERIGHDGPRVRVELHDNRTRVFVDDVEQAIHNHDRKTARSVRRALPGRGGGLV